MLYAISLLPGSGKTINLIPVSEARDTRILYHERYEVNIISSCNGILKMIAQ